ncbi:MAG: S41 family peptidase [Planctomycetota bacterium]
MSDRGRRCCGLLGLMISLLAASGCHQTDPVRTGQWLPLTPDVPDPGLIGVWEDPVRGHLVAFSEGETLVFHRNNHSCIADSGVVPGFSLYRLGRGGDRLELAHYDYRAYPHLLAAPSVLHRSELPPLVAAGGAEPGDVFGMIWRALDRWYAGFERRGVDWAAARAAFEPRARSVETNEDLFGVLSEMTAMLGDGHVNVRLGELSANAGRPRLRARLAEAWKASGSELAEGEFVARWHRDAVDSVYAVLDEGSLRSGLAGALEWGVIGAPGGDVGYLRINRFGRFTDEPVSRPEQIDLVMVAMHSALADLGDTRSLIVDVSMNGGGNDAAALTFASFFTDARRTAFTYEYNRGPAQTVELVPAGVTYDRPVFVLTSEVTASAAEAFVLAMRSIPHVTHTGERTRGDISSLLPKPFPNGFLVTIAYQRVLDAEGRWFEGVGIPPEFAAPVFPADRLYGGPGRAIRWIADGVN